jgi:hypothetical protein
VNKTNWLNSWHEVKNIGSAARLEKSKSKSSTLESGLVRYLEEIRRFPMLEPQEERLALESRDHF